MCARIECRAPLLRQGDSAIKLDPEQPWYMWIVRGANGRTGWFRKPFVTQFKNW
jgi:hypothetical protein